MTLDFWAFERPWHWDTWNWWNHIIKGYDIRLGDPLRLTTSYNPVHICSHMKTGQPKLISLLRQRHSRLIHQLLAFPPAVLPTQLAIPVDLRKSVASQGRKNKTNDWPTIETTKPLVLVISILPGWWFQSLWKIWKSVGIIIPNIWGKMFQTTNQCIVHTIFPRIFWNEPPSIHHDQSQWSPPMGQARLDFQEYTVCAF